MGNNNSTFSSSLGFFRFIKKSIAFFLLLFLVICSLFLLLVFYLQSQPLPKMTIEETTFIYSMDNVVIDDLHSVENRVYTSLSEMPKDLINATVAIEDRKFYNHFGFDIVRIGGAAIHDVTNKSKEQGASTITQQLAKNLYLSFEKTWKRKIEEVLLAIQLELQYSKDEILEMYINEIYYGTSANGIQMAAKTYFDKDVSELSLAECSMLVGIPKSPTNYSPFENMENAKNRQKLVLQAMVAEEYITIGEANAAYNTELVFKDQNQSNYPTIAPYFRDYIITTLVNDFNITEDEIFTNGLKIYTTLDSKTQQAAEEIVEKNIPADSDLQIALFTIDAKTGYIKAMVGGSDYSESQYNRVFASRQPGSTFKPILYLAALENGYTSVTKHISEPTVFTFGNDQVYEPSNFGEKYPNEEIDLRYALTHSDNIYAVKTHLDIGMDKLVNMSNRLGIEGELDPYPSLALGSQEVTPYDMTKAYAAIANQGEKVEPVAILKIEDKNGNAIYERKEVEQEQIVEATTAFIMTYLMEGVFEPGGTGFNVSDKIKRPVAGKTGTTDYDSWMIGYTPQLITTVWMGYDKDHPLTNSEAYITKTVWADYMEKAHENIAPQLFEVPKGINCLYICPETGNIATVDCHNPRLEVFIDGSEPTEYCDAHTSIDENPEPLENEVEDSSSFWSRFKYWWNN